jgi:cyanophycin synthetase
VNPTIAELIAAAERRGLSHRFPGNCANSEFLELSDGARSLFVNKTKTPFLSAVHSKIVTDKLLSSRMLEAAGLPVAPKQLSAGVSAADEKFLETHREIVIKPNRADRGVGVTERVRSLDALHSAFAKACAYGPVLLEKYVYGKEYRILVIDGRAVATLERKPLVIIGDGVSSVKSLLERLNSDPRRGPASRNHALRPIKFDQNMNDRLRRLRLRLEDTPAAGEKLQLSFANHLDSGGVACDRTDEAHPDNLRLAIAAARLFCVDVAGIDMICPDIASPLKSGDQAAILEVNPGPDIRWHIYPAEGSSRPVADEFVEYLFQRSNKAPPSQ